MSSTHKVKVFDRQSSQEQEYWAERLSGEIGFSGLRPDFPRPAAHAPETGRVEVSLPADLARLVNGVAGGSPFLGYGILMAALQACLHRYTGSERVVVGSPARRDRGPEGAGNVLPVVNDIGGGTSFRELLVRVRQSLVEAYARQSYPFERLLQDLGIERPENKSALFDIVLAAENLHAEVSARELKADLLLVFRISPEAIEGVVEFNASLFRRETVERFAGHLLNVLSAGLRDLDAPVHSLAMLSEGELRQITSGWNQTAAPFPADACIHQLFEARAAATPEAVALLFENTKVTYAELNRRANQLAHHLCARGVRPETLVGVLMERSPEMVVALLGILKAGGAYLPLDPAYPAARKAFMLEDARAPVVLSQRRVSEHLPPFGGQVIYLESDWSAIDGESAVNPPAVTTPEHLAYVIYTSGSTGVPKGVAVAHRGLCNLAAAQSRAFGVLPESHVLQFASFSFDASVSEIFMALVKGATLCLGYREALFSAAGFSQLVSNQAVTVATIPPALLAVLPADELSALKTVISAGESCPADVAARWSRGRRFFNAYGPTETTVCATLAEIQGEPQGAPPIGRPLANTGVYLLDARLQPVPVGAPGELYVEGVGLARGYLNRPGLTAEKFIPNPFSDRPGARLYRTGDLARYLPDGNVEYLGRLDQQVKIRGFRIETGEVEAVLARHAAVRDCAVVVHEAAAGEKSLNAYVVAAGGEPLDDAELRGFLRERLPEYMVPASISALAELPLTRNGKVDRAALAALGRARASQQADFAEPRTQIEKQLAEIWGELLGIEKVNVNDRFLVSIHDHFFDLGGHSLLAVQMFSRVRAAFGVELPLNLIFTSAPTIAGLAKAIEDYTIESADVNEIAAMLEELDGLSDEELQALLDSEDPVLD
ncbi:MAG TPA: amino acid adenylation domain-containing protein [Pyrinomonadaceae bacterium]|jgi:amino acid adenylation domain-containing protein